MALKRKEWLEEGFNLLTEFAQNKLTIQYLCERLKVTRGSFYHHFKGIDHYVDALMEEWAERNTLMLVKDANKANSPMESMDRLSKSISKKDQSIEAAIRSWSFYHPIVGKHVERVDKLRLNHLTDIFQSLGLPNERARLRAELDYGTLTGIQLLFPQITKERLEALWVEQRQMVMRD